MLLPILQVNSEDIPPYVLVCGDPGRAAVIAARLEGARELAFSREYRTFVGQYEGITVAVASHGVGSAGAAICFEELIRGGATTLIRVGTAGSYSEETPAGSLVVSTAAVRAEGLTRQLVPDGFPAVGDGRVVQALYESALEQGGVVRHGITVSLDVFFQGALEIPHKAYKQAGAVAVEMEIAALYVVASLRGARAGAIVAVDGYADSDLAAEYDPHTNVVAQAVEREIAAALGAVVKLSRSDRG
ncbi:purine-nucleoside phosphorylase [Cohnella sp. CIP 111063]|uniref:nucleoside phosphorylase n=1 Tax=unclassified Cohnella TaxID=2636738 RepID=UPI000B8C2765|nr:MULTISPECIES: nucleoside phosphorylase [unclassified Cohnella]OXS60292.1 purine-nucleoside phosphorylase [Cohnella sp. CIP 111063]PRX72975.1 uridine phosphorylase [Cohnella sp. SGD-V74]